MISTPRKSWEKPPTNGNTRNENLGNRPGTRASASDLAQGVGEEEFRQLLAAWSKRDPRRALGKATLYLGSGAALIAAILNLDSWPLILLCQALLGLLYAHGLELVHECLHHNMFRRPLSNRIFGFLASLPLLVSYSHYKYQHLHHHRFVGTPEDKELFDYEPQSLRNPLTFIVRAWNFMRIPAFFADLFRMLRGKFPDVFITPRQRREVLSEYLLLAVFFIGAVILTVARITDVFLLVWFMPWLLFGEAFHFFIELPEHLGRDKTRKEIFTNTRSYACSNLFSYMINGNNYHVEHHLHPRVAVHNLRRLNDHLNSRAGYTLPSYWSALSEALQGSAEINAVSGETRQS